MEKITEQVFREEITNSEPTIVSFSTEWCTPCKKLIPVLDELSSTFRVFKVDAEEARDLSIEMMIMAVPTTLIFKNGTEIFRKTGLISAEDLTKRIEESNG